MIHGKSNRDFVLDLLLDFRPHFSREFVQGPSGEPLLLDYRKRISELRTMGYNVKSIRLKDTLGHTRPAYQLFHREDLFQAA